jgi:heme/copper-type cytochrome/quinol oxidase subunit 2
MNDPRHSNKSNPTTRVAVFVVVVVLLVIATFVFNAIKGKREYAEQNAASTAPAAEAASTVTAASASGASQ